MTPGPVFLQKRGVLYISEQGFFFGVMSVTFLGPGRVFFGTLGGLSKRRGRFAKKEGGFKERISCRAPVKKKDNLYMHALSM